jgi:aminopeptidase N
LNNIKGALFLLLAAILLASGCSRQTAKAPHPSRPSIGGEQIPLGKLPPAVIPLRYRITLTVNPSAERFSGHVEIDVRFSEKRRAIFLHGRGLNVLAASVRLNARHSITAHYAQADKSGVARLIFVDEVPAGKATLVFDYDAPFGKSLSGLYKVVERGDAYAFTQFESISAREAFPCFDEPGFKTPFQLSVIAPSADKVISDVPVQAATRQRAGGTTATLFQWTRPLPTYLMALAVGPLDVVDAGEIPASAYRTHPVHLRGIAARGQGRRLTYALSLTPKIVLALENYFAVAFPFPKLDLIAVPNFAAGAMENAGAITFRERLLLVDANAPLDQKRSSLAVQAHEISHQWLGDLVTPAWWDDVWLNESLANWMEYKTAQSVMPELQFDTNTLRNGFDAMDLDELPGARAVRQPVPTSGDIDNAFDDITYGKGSAILLMFESFLGDDNFRSAMHAYLVKYANRSATADDFIETIATAARVPSDSEKVDITIERTGAITWNSHPVASMAALIDQETHMAASASPQQVANAFHDFISQPAIPYLRFDIACAGAPAARVAQSAYTPIGGQPRRLAWHVPVCLKDEGGDRFCRIVDRKVSDVLLGASCPIALMPNDQGKGYYRFNLGVSHWHALIERASQLSPANQIALLSNLSAAMYAGDAPPSDLLLAIQKLAPTARWDVLWTIDQTLHRLRLRAVTPTDLPLYRGFVSANFAKRFFALGIRGATADDAATTLARRWLATLMVSEARDVSVITDLASAANAYLAGKPDAAPAPELLGEAMRAGVITGGAPFAAKLMSAFQKTSDENERQLIVYAFAGSDDSSLMGPLLSYALTQGMRTGELRYLYQHFAQEPVAQVTLWAWYKTNYRTLLGRVSRDGMRNAPRLLSEACDASSRDDIETFFRPKVSELTGIARPLELAEESISRCIAFREIGAQSLETALRNAAQ